MSTFIITGANGFIGHRLVNQLVQNPDNNVICVLRNNSSDYYNWNNTTNVKIVFCSMDDYCDLADKLNEMKPDCFIHLAWDGSTGIKRSDYTMQTNNIKNSIDAFKAAEKLECSRFLCAGTVSENITDQINSLKSVSQNMIYAQAKKSLYEFLCILSKESKTKLVWMQFSNTYGPGNKSGNLISYFFSEIRKCSTPEFGSGNEPYNFIYIDDLVNGIIALSSAELTQNKYFIGSDEIWLLKEYLIKIPIILNKDIKVGLGKRSDDGIHYKREWFDNSQLKKDTGFVIKHSFVSGIIDSYEKE